MTSIAILMGGDWNKAEVQTMESWIESWTTSSLLSSIGLGTNFSIYFKNRVLNQNEQRMRILNPSADKEFLSQRLYNHLMDCENCFNSQIHLERYEHRMEAGIQEISGSLTDLDETQRIKEPDVGTSTQPEVVKPVETQ
ncbi:hypothetical protein L2E82_24686 [Cichorium intybus]|uniref:Uncharacterized protein n=1 Tax=Cichorium intybus TaxID=13427 RepID=A0ACB9E2J0_CICIN|nr:hypothetical protein L2E82_24686 [Cichorium intybus]